jgi:hypothetical protein
VPNDPHVRVSVELSPAVSARPDLWALVSHPVLLAVVLDPATDPPVGQVHHGSARWRFANRVQLLEAIDAASRQAQGGEIR